MGAAAGTVVFEGRLIDSSTWTPVTVTRSGSGSSSRDGISLQGLPAGTYEFRAVYTSSGVTTALGSGTVTVHPATLPSTPAPTASITTPVYTPGYTNPATPAQYSSTSTSGSLSKAVSLTGSGLGYMLTQSASMNGYSSDRAASADRPAVRPLGQRRLDHRSA